jgi:hypothetical protein
MQGSAELGTVAGPRRMPAAAAEDRHWPVFTIRTAALSLAAGLAVVLLTTPIGSGDYGQWLMTARGYAGLATPSYHPVTDVPPLVPWAIARIHAAVADPVFSLQLTAAAVLGQLALAFYLCGSWLFRRPAAGLLAATLALLGTDQLLDLFTFGGLLQGAALGFLVLGIGALGRASPTRRPWLWSGLGAASLALGAASHLATGAIGLAAGVAVVGADSLRGPGRPWRADRVPVLVCLGLVGAWWLLVLLPGSPSYASNPASLNYRGPDRLFEALTADPRTIALVLGALSELRRRRPGPWLAVSAWMFAVLAVLGVALVTSAATDYPRFTTPLLAPLAIGTAGGLLAAARRLAAVVRRRGLRPSRMTGALAATALVVALAPAAVTGYETEAHGYRISDMAGLQDAAAWIQRTVPTTDATILAPAREGKWLEGLTGRAALFDNTVRYSFRPEEWARGFAADALLQGTASVTNPFFFLRFDGGAPCSTPAVPADRLVVGANHGGEFVDLLRLGASDIRLLAADGSVLATVGNLPGVEATTSSLATTGPDGITLRSEWQGRRGAATLDYAQVATVVDGSSTLELTGRATSSGPIGGLVLRLRPASGARVTDIRIAGSEATLTFARSGLRDPALRLTIAHGTGTFSAEADGSLLVRSPSGLVTLLVTDLTASSRSAADLALLCPANLAAQYGVAAALLPRDGALAARTKRLAAVGLTEERDFGAYAVLARPATATR